MAIGVSVMLKSRNIRPYFSSDGVCKDYMWTSLYHPIEFGCLRPKFHSPHSSSRTACTTQSKNYSGTVLEDDSQTLGTSARVHMYL